MREVEGLGDVNRLVRLGELAGVCRYPGESVVDFRQRLAVLAHRQPMLVTAEHFEVFVEVVAGWGARAKVHLLASEYRMGVDVYVPWFRCVTVRQRVRLELRVRSALEGERPVNMLISPIRVRRRRRRTPQEDGHGSAGQGQAHQDGTRAAGDA